MSLLAWYPLNGDTKDYSGNNRHMNSNKIKIDSQGKIGQCYNFDGTAIMFNEGWNLNTGNIYDNFTATAWIYPTEYPSTNGFNILSFNGNNVLRFRLNSNKGIWILWGGQNQTGFSTLEYNNIISLNTWTHVCCRLKDKKMSLFINGKLITTQGNAPIIMNSSTFLIGGYNNEPREVWRGKLNDIRLYDEALTAMQIKEIAQAKICHLSLNENIQPRKNLLTDKYILKRGSFPTIFGKDEIGNYFIKTKDSGYFDGIWINYLPIDANAYYTVSFEIWCEKSFSLKYDFNISADGQSSNDFPRAQELAINGWDYDTPYQWKKFAMRSIAKPDMKNTKLFDTIAGYGTDYTSMLGTKIYYRNIMVEKKDRWAPYIENEQAISLRNIDNSWKLPIPVTATHEFPKYEDNSFKFNKYSSITTNIQLTDEMIANVNSQMTISIWIKPTATPTQDSYGIIVGKADYQGIGLGFKYKDTNSIYVYAYHRLNGGNNITTTMNDVTSIKLNIWTHIAAKLNKSTGIISLYVNGEKLSENNCSQGNRTINGPIQIGGLQEPWGSGPFDSFQGYMKDCRIYTTALSDEDIKLLYQPEVIIDKANTIRCSEINEVSKTIKKHIEIKSKGLELANQAKVIVDDYIRQVGIVGWEVIEIKQDNTINVTTFATHSNNSFFVNMINHIQSLNKSSIVILATRDQPSGNPQLTSNNNGKAFLSFLNSIGSNIQSNFPYRGAYAGLIYNGQIVKEEISYEGVNSSAEIILDELLIDSAILDDSTFNGFNKNATLNFKEFSEIPEIQSGVHNLKLGNDILPVLIDMDNDGDRWARIFYHNNHSGTVLFSNDNDWAEAKETNTNNPTTSDKYSILSRLECFRQNTNCYFEFKLKYPTLAPNEQNIWKQKSNPTFETVKNYKPINISWTSQGWGGLERSSLFGNTDDTFIDGTVNHFNWYYAIGAKTSWQGGIPAWDVPVMDVVELWIRINDFDLFTDINQEIAINSKTLTAKEFKEIY